MTRGETSFAARESALHQQSKMLLERRRDSDPENRQNLISLASLYRRMGNLKEALSTYETLAQGGCLESGYWASVLAGSTEFREPDLGNRRLACFRVYDNYLSMSRLSDVLQAVSPLRSHFRPSKVRNRESASSHDAREFRSSLTCALPNELGWLTERWQTELPCIAKSMGLGTSEVSLVGGRITLYTENGFFLTHKDTAKVSDSGPQFILLYYFQFPEADFEGGELIIYDAEKSTDTPSSSYTSLRPISNRLVVLNAHDYHEVLKVSGQTPWPLGRFAVTGVAMMR